MRGVSRLVRRQGGNPAFAQGYGGQAALAPISRARSF